MVIETRAAQMRVDEMGVNAYINIRTIIGGFCGQLEFAPMYGKFWLCRWKDSSLLYIIVVPDEGWRETVEEEGYTIFFDLAEWESLAAADQTEVRNKALDEAEKKRRDDLVAWMDSAGSDEEAAVLQAMINIPSYDLRSLKDAQVGSATEDPAESGK